MRGGAIRKSGRMGRRAKPGLAGLAQNPPPMMTAWIALGNLFASLRASGVEKDSAMMTVCWPVVLSSERSEHSHLNSLA